VYQVQGGEQKYRDAWQKICEVSRSEFDLVYKRMNVELEEKVLHLSVLLIISKYCSLKNFQLQLEISIRSHEALFERHQLVFILLFNIPCYTPSEFKMSEVFSLIKYELVELIQSYTCPFAF
jgi:hypothetical protein